MITTLITVTTGLMISTLLIKFSAVRIEDDVEL